MGGNALKIKTRRHTKQEVLDYYKLVDEFLKTQNVQYTITKSYESKETFGDMDVLIASAYSDVWKNKILEHFKPEEYTKGDSVVSFNLGELQTDFIFTGIEKYEMSKIYYDFNIIGACMGMIANKIRLKFSNNGLSLTIHSADKTYIVCDTNITKDIPTIFKLLDLDYSRYLQGFETLEDIFEFIMKSKYFCPRTLMDSTRKYSSSIQKFQIYLKDKLGVDYPTKPKLNKFELYEFYDKEFPEAKVMEKYNIGILKYETKKLISQKYRGTLIMEWVGLKGKELGYHLNNFKSNFADFNAYALSNSCQTIKTDFLTYYNSYISSSGKN